MFPVHYYFIVNLPEWSKGPDLRSGVFARVGSNPTIDNVVGMGVKVSNSNIKLISYN